ncbi:Collagen alpha-2(IV) chain [Acipenser ruthenus]|uniref:Collagen alpha-2(IV) chain n=1 Tax=Acipenser ruthenus TaxID=7906 RepID=A0A444V7I5_ACIRT|nr:Collagen alpha-2(IV) chain [Acipenser ruthenus]
MPTTSEPQKQRYPEEDNELTTQVGDQERVEILLDTPAPDRGEKGLEAFEQVIKEEAAEMGEDQEIPEDLQESQEQEQQQSDQEDNEPATAPGDPGLDEREEASSEAPLEEEPEGLEKLEDAEGLDPEKASVDRRENMLGGLPGRTGLEASCHDVAEGGTDEDRSSASPEAQEEISEPEEEDGEMSYHYPGYHGTLPVSQLFRDLQELATLERYREEEAAIVQGHLSTIEEAGGRDGRHEREEEVEEEQNETKLWKQRLKMASIEEEEEEDEEGGDILVSRLSLEGAEKIYEEIDSGDVFEVVGASAETSIEEPEHGELDEAEKREASAENWGDRLSSGFQSGEAEKTRGETEPGGMLEAVQTSVTPTEHGDLGELASRDGTAEGQSGEAEKTQGETELRGMLDERDDFSSGEEGLGKLDEVIKTGAADLGEDLEVSADLEYQEEQGSDPEEDNDSAVKDQGGTLTPGLQIGDAEKTEREAELGDELEERGEILSEAPAPEHEEEMLDQVEVIKTEVVELGDDQEMPITLEPQKQRDPEEDNELTTQVGDHKPEERVEILLEAPTQEEEGEGEEEEEEEEEEEGGGEGEFKLGKLKGLPFDQETPTALLEGEEGTEKLNQAMKTEATQAGQRSSDLENQGLTTPSGDHGLEESRGSLRDDPEGGTEFTGGQGSDLLEEEISALSPEDQDHLRDSQRQGKETGENEGVPTLQKTGEREGVPGLQETGESEGVPGLQEMGEREGVPGLEETGESEGVPGLQETGEREGVPGLQEMGEREGVLGLEETGESERVPGLQEMGESEGVPGLEETGESEGVPGLQEMGEREGVLGLEETGEREGVPGLQEMGESEGVPGLEETGESEGVPGLQEMGERERVPGLQEMGEREGVPGLEEMGESEGVPMLQEMGKSEGVPELQEMGEREGVPGLQQMVEREGVPGLQEMGEREGVPGLQEMEEREGVPGLQEMGESEGVPGLQEMGESEGVPGLQGMGEREGVPGLQEMGEREGVPGLQEMGEREGAGGVMETPAVESTGSRDECDGSLATAKDTESRRFEPLGELQILDVRAQKSRIALRNKLSRPPRAPKELLQTPSLAPSPPTPQKLPRPAGMGLPFRLPGLG